MYFDKDQMQIQPKCQDYNAVHNKYLTHNRPFYTWAYVNSQKNVIIPLHFKALNKSVHICLILSVKWLLRCGLHIMTLIRSLTQVIISLSTFLI